MSVELPAMNPDVRSIGLMKGSVDAAVGRGGLTSLRTTIGVAAVEGGVTLRHEADDRLLHYRVSYDRESHRLTIEHEKGDDLFLKRVRIFRGDRELIEAGNESSSWGSELATITRGISAVLENEVRVELEVFSEIDLITIPVMIRDLPLPGGVVADR
jgi:hypothetical protein